MRKEKKKRVSDVAAANSLDNCVHHVVPEKETCEQCGKKKRNKCQM